ncbi:MAG: SPOR domain-containing protein [Gemmatimonadales bacterium]
MHRGLAGLTALAATLAGCGGQRVPPFHHLPASVATPPADAAVLRVSRGGGTVQLLHANSLATDESIIPGDLPAISRLLAPSASGQDAIVYAADHLGRLLVIDLRARRFHLVPGSARQLTGTMDGVILGVDSARHPIRYADDVLTTYRGTVEPGAVLLRGPGDEIVVVGNRPGVLQVFTPQREVRHMPIADGRLAETWVGDLVASVTDSGVDFADPTGGTRDSRRLPSFVRMRTAPVVGRFSPSGHRLYVATRHGGLAVIDRFNRRPLSTIKLSGNVTDLRVDRTGRWLMAHAKAGDSLWIVDLTRAAVDTTLRAPWADDLPQIVDGRTLLVRQNGNVLAVDLRAAAQAHHGVLAGGAGDLFMLLPWIPKGQPAVEAAAPPPTPAPDTTAAPTPPAATGTAAVAAAAPPAPATGSFYVQVSSSQNSDWAQALATQLKDGGFPAKVLDPRTSDEGYRVVIGPYPSHDEADAAGKKLGRAYFIVPVAPGGN